MQPSTVEVIQCNYNIQLTYDMMSRSQKYMPTYGNYYVSVVDYLFICSGIHTQSKLCARLCDKVLSITALHH